MTTSSFFNLFFLLDRYDRDITFWNVRNFSKFLWASTHLCEGTWVLDLSRYKHPGSDQQLIRKPMHLREGKKIEKFFLLMLTLTVLFKVKNVFNVDARKKSTNTHHEKIFKNFCSLFMYLSNKKIIFEKYVVFSEKSITFQNSHYLHWKHYFQHHSQTDT